MGFHKFLLAIYILGSALAHFALAQSSPQDYVDAHNAARAQVGVQAITWNETVAGYARRYASSRVAAHCDMEHSGGPYGENLAEGYGQMSGSDAVQFWLTEKPTTTTNPTHVLVESACTILRSFGVTHFILGVLMLTAKMGGGSSFVAIILLEILRESVLTSPTFCACFLLLIN